jgi:hypothetical protein
MGWAALIGFAVSLFKTFMDSAASSAGGAAGKKIGEAMVRRVGEAPAQTIIAAAQPQASRVQKISASQELLNALKTNGAFRDEVRAILAKDYPEALQVGNEVQRHLESAPAEVQEVKRGAKPVTDFLDPLYLWTGMDSTPLSVEQAAFLRSPTFHRVCPVNHEDLGWDGVRYYWMFGTRPVEINLPTTPLPDAIHNATAVCKDGHRWPVYAA